MGTQIIQLADYQVPSFRRQRRAPAPTGAPMAGGSPRLATAHPFAAPARSRADTHALAPDGSGSSRLPNCCLPQGFSPQPGSARSPDAGAACAAPGSWRAPDATGAAPASSWQSQARRRGQLRALALAGRAEAPSFGSQALPVRVRRAAGGADGRLSISGRMTDVCAELERLAAAEAQAMARSLRS